jgi:hypothetical protein
MFRFSYAPLRQSFMGLVMTLATAAALALPSPQDIDAAVSAGHLSQAESLLREVIQAKPNSAKAQYELGQVLARQARYADAQAALVQAKTLDPSLKFAASPDKFNDVFNKVSQQAKNVTGAQASSVASGLSEPRRAAAGPVPSAPEPAFPLQYVWIGIAGLVVLALVLRRQKAATPTYNAPMQAGGPINASPYAPGQVAGAGYGPGYGPGYPGGQPMGGGMGSGIGGAVVGGVAGVAAGYALSKALEGDHSNHPAPANPSNNGGYVPFDTPAQPDVGNFDAGSGSDWDDASDSAGSDDSW